MTTQLIDAVNDVMDELGLARPGAIVDSPDPNARRVLACAQRAGQALWREHDWSVLHREYTFTTESGVDNYPLPEDWGRGLGDTAWDRSTFWEMRGSLTPTQWQRRRSGLVASAAIRFGYRTLVGSRQGSILLDPVPAGAHNLVIEYITSYWIENTATEPFERFRSDFHHIRLDPELFRLGLMWRVRKAYGLPYGDDRADYEAKLRAVKVHDLHLPMVNAAPDYDHLPLANIPEGSWGQ